MRSDGTSWTETVVASGSSSFTLVLPGIWGAPGGELFASTYPSRALHHDGARWVTQQMSGQVHRVWGTSRTDVYAVGSSVFHFDGSAWSPVATPSRYTLNGVWGSSSTSVFAVGNGRTIVHGTP